VLFAGGATRVVALGEPAVEGVVVEAAFDDENLFWVVVGPTKNAVDICYKSGRGLGLCALVGW
jgi:hypothetical protein